MCTLDKNIVQHCFTSILDVTMMCNMCVHVHVHVLTLCQVLPWCNMLRYHRTWAHVHNITTLYNITQHMYTPWQQELTSLHITKHNQTCNNICTTLHNKLQRKITWNCTFWHTITWKYLCTSYATLLQYTYTQLHHTTTCTDCIATMYQTCTWFANMLQHCSYVTVHFATSYNMLQHMDTSWEHCRTCVQCMSTMCNRCA